MSGLHTFSFFAMNTRVDIAVHGVSPEVFSHVARSCRHEMDRIEKLLSRYLPESEIYRLNHRQNSTVRNIDPEVFSLLLLCFQFQKLTLGYFNICINKENAFSAVPDPGGIEFDEKGYSVFFPAPSVQFDLGGIGKGYALNRLHEILMAHEVYNAFISAGESSVLLLGNHPCGRGWKAGIMNPSRTAVVYEWHSDKGFISSSSSVNGHIINPRTAEPLFSKKTASVMDLDGVIAEALSTSLVLAGEEEIDQLLNNFSHPQCVIFEPEETTGKNRIKKFNI